MADEIEVDGNKYRIAKMSVFEQAHVARKVAPVVISLGQGYAVASQSNGSNGAEQTENSFFFNAFGPISNVLAHMEEQDVDYVLKKCLGAVSRWTGQGYVPMMRAGNLMFDDIDLANMMQIVMEVVTHNLGPSLRALLPLNLPAEDQPSP